MSKGKKDKNRVFVVNLRHDSIFSPYPFSYIHGDEKQLTDFDFKGMSYDNLRELVRKMVHSPVSSLYYCKVGKTIKQGLCRLENDADVQEFLKTGYESKWVVDLYVEHHEYDPMDYKNSNDRDYESPYSSDAYCSSDDEQPILGMRYDHPEQLKLALANYGVACGYQLWFQKNDWRQLLVYCGRDVSTRRCAGSCKVGEGISKEGEGSSRNSDVSPK
ncbi:hypothetical protein Tco_0749454 [Tanacetum coccineum]|uniref:PB1-like domain-containing protein n=1 Tax=Tanacetum coccineum TaxID=301880 RepID=A0ABQ4Z205_9ASTR